LQSDSFLPHLFFAPFIEGLPILDDCIFDWLAIMLRLEAVLGRVLYCRSLMFFSNVYLLSISFLMF